MDKVDGSNDGLKERIELFSKQIGEKIVYNTTSTFLCGDFPIDITSPTEPILNGVTLRLELTLADHKFVLMSNVEDAQYEVTFCRLACPVGVPQRDQFGKVISRLKKEAAMYHFKRREVVRFNINKNSVSYISDVVFPGGMLPSKVIVFVTSTTAWDGDYKKNPYNFLMTDSGKSTIKYIDLSMNSSHIDGLTWQKETDSKQLSYYRMFRFNQMNKTPFSNGITYDMFKKG